MKYLLLLSTVFALSSCKYNSTFTQIKNLETSKNKVEEISSQDLNVENQKIIRAYFSTIKDLTYEFMNNSKMQRYTHKKFSKFFNESICEKIILDEGTYTELMTKCTVNGFYICSEEVKDYKSLLIRAKKLLNESELKMISSNNLCKSKLLDLGVINE